MSIGRGCGVCFCTTTITPLISSLGMETIFHKDPGEAFEIMMSVPPDRNGDRGRLYP